MAPRRHAPAPGTTGRRALEEKTNTTNPRGRTFIGSSDETSKDLTKIRTRNTGTNSAAEHESSIGGRLNRGVDRESSAKAQKTRDPKGNEYTEPGANERTMPMRRPTRLTRKPVRSAMQPDVLEGLKRRMEETARQTATESGFALNYLHREGEGTVSPSRGHHPRQHSPKQPLPGLGNSSMATPAVDNSILALRHFKRRPRQASILQIVQQKIASARPSAVHIPSDDSLTDFDLAASDEDDFFPEAEGTPLRRDVANQGNSVSTTPAISQPMLEEDSRIKIPRPKEPNSLFSTNGRFGTKEQRAPKSILSTIEHGHAQRQDSKRRFSNTAELEPASNYLDKELQQHPKWSPSEHEIECDGHQTPNESVLINTEYDGELAGVNNPQVVSDDTMADPLSSSPPCDIRYDTDRVDLAGRNAPRRRKNNPQREALSVSTAHLQALLPKRRRRTAPKAQKSVYDISDGDSERQSSEDYETDDVVISNRKRKRVFTKETKQREKSQKTSVARKKRAPNKASHSSIRSPTPTPTSNANAGGEKVVRRRELKGLSGPKDVLTVAEPLKSKELEEAKEKFATIDDWEMDFETLSGDEHRDSSQTWR